MCNRLVDPVIILQIVINLLNADDSSKQNCDISPQGRCRGWCVHLRMGAKQELNSHFPQQEVK